MAVYCALIRRKKQAGVTLIEILVAMVILTIGLFMVYQIFPMGFSASFRSKNTVIAIQLAQGKMEEIMKGNYKVDCPKNHVGMGNCKYVPDTVDYDAYLHTYGSEYDCRYYYGVPKRTKDSSGARITPSATDPVLGATVDIFDTGNYEDPESWVSFGGDYNKFWYNIEVTPVRDPAANYAGYQGTTLYRKSLYRDFGALSRVTVRVRGPIEDMNNWNLFQASGRAGNPKPAEVVLSSFIANKNLGSSKISVSHTNDTSICSLNAPHTNTSRPYLPFDNPTPSRVVQLYVENIRNFSVFNKLTDDEINDPSAVYKKSVGKYAELYSDYPKNNVAGNPKNMDNVIITLVNTNSTPDDPTDDTLIACQTNKIISMWPDDTNANPDAQQVPGFIVLSQPLLYESACDIFAAGDPAPGQTANILHYDGSTWKRLSTTLTLPSLSVKDAWGKGKPISDCVYFLADASPYRYVLSYYIGSTEANFNLVGNRFQFFNNTPTPTAIWGQSDTSITAFCWSQTQCSNTNKIWNGSVWNDMDLCKDYYSDTFISRIRDAWGIQNPDNGQTHLFLAGCNIIGAYYVRGLLLNDINVKGAGGSNLFPANPSDQLGELYAVKGISKDEVFFAGWNPSSTGQGIVYKYTSPSTDLVRIDNNSFPAPYRLYDIYPTSSNNIVVVGGGGVLGYTTDGGTNWSKTSYGNISFKSICSDGSTFYVAGKNESTGRGVVYKSTDGYNLTEVGIPPDTYPLNTIVAVGAASPVNMVKVDGDQQKLFTGSDYEYRIYSLISIPKVDAGTGGIIR